MFLHDTSETQAKPYRHALGTLGMQECSEDTGKCISMILKRFNYDFTKEKQCHQDANFFRCNFSNWWIAMNNGSLTPCESN